MTVFYTYSLDTVFVNIIVEIDGIAWDFTEGFPGIEYYEGRREDRKSDLIHLIQRWIKFDSLRTAFHNAPDDEKYPASEILARFPDAVKL